jgi:CRP-like cAMP-binding protein/CheY-like chemotaxis protein
MFTAWINKPRGGENRAWLARPERYMYKTVHQLVLLLTEADPVIAVDLKDALERANYRVLGPVTTVAGALLLLEQDSPTLAIIDAVLTDGRCTDLARALRQRSIPFLVHSFGRQDQIPGDEFQGIPWLSKPALPADMLTVLNELSASARMPMEGAQGPEPVTSMPLPHPRVSASNPLVHKLEGFTSLSDADRALLVRISAETRDAAPGTDLVREGDAPEGVFLVMKGIACRHKLRANGTRQIMAYLVPGDVCDLDVALLDQMDHTITTVSACEVVRLAPETVADLLTHHPQIARGLRKSQLVDEATLREWLVNVGRRLAVERIAHLFCELHLRVRAIGPADENRFEMPMTQRDLADTTGMTNVHVNRSLWELRQKGLIELQQKHLTILDLPRLKQLAEFRSNYLHLGNRAAA